MDFQWIKCPGCRNIYDDNIHLPKTLNCGHTICQSCLEGQDKRNIALCCRNCSQGVDIRQFNTNTLILDYIKKLKRVNLDLLGKTEPDEENSFQYQTKSQSLKKISQNIKNLSQNLETEKITQFKEMEKRIGQIESVVTNKTAPNESNAQINKILAEKNQIIANFESQILSYKNKLISKKEKIKKQKQDLQRLQQIQARKKGDQEKELESRLSLIQEVQKLNEVINQLKQEAQELKDYISQSEAQLQIADLKIENQEKEIQQFRQQSYKQDMNYYTSQIYQLQEYIQKLEIKILDMENQNELVKQQYQSCQLELDEMKEAEKQNSIKEKMQTNKYIIEKNNDIENLKNAIQQKDSLLFQMEQKVMNVTKESQELQKTIMLQQQELDKKMQVDINPKISNTQNKQIQNQNILLKEENKKLKDIIQEMQADEDHMKQVVKILEDNKIKQEKFIAQLEKQIMSNNSQEVKQSQQICYSQEKEMLRNKSTEFQLQCQCHLIEQQLFDIFSLIYEQFQDGKSYKTDVKEFIGFSLQNQFQIITLQLKAILSDKKRQKDNKNQNSSLKSDLQSLAPWFTPRSSQEQRAATSTRRENLKYEILDTSQRKVNLNNSIKDISKSKIYSDKIFPSRKFDSKSPQQRGITPDEFSTKQSTSQKLTKLKRQWNLDFDLEKKYQQIKDGYLLDQTKKEIEKSKKNISYKQKFQ